MAGRQATGKINCECLRKLTFPLLSALNFLSLLRDKFDICPSDFFPLLKSETIEIIF